MTFLRTLLAACTLRRQSPKTIEAPAMTEPTTPERTERTAKLTTYVTTVDGKPVAYVRHHSSRQAEAFALNGKVETRRATEDELIELGRKGERPIGPFEPAEPAEPAVDDGQGSLEIE
jgi:hypothetical protein